MKKSVFSSIAALVLASAASISAQTPKAVDQLGTKDQQQNVSVPAAAQPDDINKGNPILDALFGGGNNHGGPGGPGGPGFPGHPGGPGGPGFPGHPGGPGGWPGGPGGPGQYGRVTCVASDMGWEEHWGGHGGGPNEMDACRQCFQSHGDCRFNCTMEQFRCSAQFNPAQPPVNPGQVQPPAPAPTPYTGDLRPDQGSAQDNAMMRCLQYSQGQYGNCVPTGCKREDQSVRSGRCRK